MDNTVRHPARARRCLPIQLTSVRKALSDEHGQHVMGLAKDLAGAHGMLAGSGPAGPLPPRSRTGPTEINFDAELEPGVDPVWHYGFLFSPALTIGGGTWAVQRNIIGEHVLGLPRDPRRQASSSSIATGAPRSALR